MNAQHNHWSVSDDGEAPMSGALSIQVSASRGDDRDAPKPRRSGRVAVDFDGTLRQRGAPAVSVHVLDLSVDGFRVDSHLDLAVGTEVWLRLPGLEPYLAHVAWADGYLAGCAFERPLHPAVLDMIIRRARGG